MGYGFAGKKETTMEVNKGGSNWFGYLVIGAIVLWVLQKIGG